MDDLQYQTEILKAAKALFYKHGYSKVTVNDVAKCLSISKKTIYKYYPSKHHMLVLILENMKNAMADGVENTLSNNELAYPAKLKKILTIIALHLSEITPVFMEDVMVNFPRLWKELDRYKKEGAFLRFNKLLIEGIEKRHIKKDVNKALVVALYASAIDHLLNPKFLQQLPEELLQEMPESPAEIFDKTVNLIFESILNEESIIQFRNA